jgi:hypothetical protein
MPTNCSCVLNEYTLACRNNTGGIQKVWIGCYNSDCVYTLDANNIITGATGCGSGTAFYSFEQEIETGSFVQNGQFSTENGTTFFEQVLEITLHKMDSTQRNRVQSLAIGAWRVVILDQQGNYWMMGHQNPVRVTSATPQLGKAYGDLNGAIITFTGKEPENAYSINAAYALSIL